MMDFEDRFFSELRDIQKRFPGFNIIYKRDSTLCAVIHWVLWCLTFGKLDFSTRFHTVIGKRLYVGSDWDKLTYASRWVVLRHERVHLQQAKKMGLGWFWGGWVLFSLLYLFALPFGLTLRSWWELEAYREQAYCGKIAGYPMSRAWLRKQLTGPNYLWACLIPVLVDHWLDKTPCLDP